MHRRRRNREEEGPKPRGGQGLREDFMA